MTVTNTATSCIVHVRPLTAGATQEYHALPRKQKYDVAHQLIILQKVLVYGTVPWHVKRFLK